MNPSVFFRPREPVIVDHVSTRHVSRCIGFSTVLCLLRALKSQNDPYISDYSIYVLCVLAVLKLALNIFSPPSLCLMLSNPSSTHPVPFPLLALIIYYWLKIVMNKEAYDASLIFSPVSLTHLCSYLLLLYFLSFCVYSSLHFSCTFIFRNSNAPFLFLSFYLFFIVLQRWVRRW